MDTRRQNTWIEISEGAYAENLAFFRRLIGPGVELAAVVKANAYGHGMELVAGLAARHGADSFCVHSPSTTRSSAVWRPTCRGWWWSRAPTREKGGRPAIIPPPPTHPKEISPWIFASTASSSPSPPSWP